MKKNITPIDTISMIGAKNGLISLSAVSGVSTSEFAHAQKMSPIMRKRAVNTEVIMVDRMISLRSGISSLIVFHDLGLVDARVSHLKIPT